MSLITFSYSNFRSMGSTPLPPVKNLSKCAWWFGHYALRLLSYTLPIERGGFEPLFSLETAFLKLDGDRIIGINIVLNRQNRLCTWRTSKMSKTSIMFVKQYIGGDMGY
jgi:hypothetical protein